MMHRRRLQSDDDEARRERRHEELREARKRGREMKYYPLPSGTYPDVELQRETRDEEEW